MDDRQSLLNNGDARIVVEVSKQGRISDDTSPSERKQRRNSRRCGDTLCNVPIWQVTLFLVVFTSAVAVRQWLFSNGDDWPTMTSVSDFDTLKSIIGFNPFIKEANSSAEFLPAPGPLECTPLDKALTEAAVLREKLVVAVNERAVVGEKTAAVAEGGAEWGKMQEKIKAAQDNVLALQAVLDQKDKELNSLRVAAWQPPEALRFQTAAAGPSVYPQAELGGKYLAKAAALEDTRLAEVPVPKTVTDAITGKLRKILPEERAERLCGKVWEEYAAFHHLASKDMREKGRTEPHRLAVLKKGRGMFGEGGGLGDTGSAHVSVLVFAMLTGRVFQEYWNHHKEVFHSPYINTMYTEKEEYLDLLPEGMTNTWIASKDGRAATSTSQVASAGQTFDMLAEQEARESGNLNRGRFNHTVELFDLNKGISHLLWRNEPTARQLESLGLTHNTTYGCLSHFLIRPTPSTKEKMQSLVDTMTEPDTFTISIHVRTDYSDQALLKGGTEVDKVTVFWAPFQCALEVEKMYAYEGQRVIWYLATDSKKLRDDAATTFGSSPEKRQVVFMPEAPHHIGWGTGKRNGEDCASWEWNCNSTDFVTNLRSTFVDWYLLSLADFHVITESGLGTTAAGRSMSTNTTFKVSNGKWPPPETQPGEPLCTGGPTSWASIESARGAFK